MGLKISLSLFLSVWKRVHVVTFNSFKVQNYFSLKARTPKPLLSSVVYEFSCQVDPGISYIGKTKRHLERRMREHRSSNSAIRDHLLLCTPCSDNFDCNSFRVLRVCRDSLSLSIVEALSVKDCNPFLNSQLTTKGSSFMLKLF